ncbi:MAG: PstS family phosphate ABC transporter substrate-binding protein [Bacteroidetes bacterium]|nr:MAG: PstS family phosphate ABC transporter substrate-binding protein [Bacteroidota bacterium]
MKKKILNPIRLILLLLIVSSCGQDRGSGYDEDGNLYGRVSISGAWAMYPLTVKWADEFRKAHPKVQIDISAGGAGKGMADVLGNMVDIAMVSREITEVETSRGAWFIGVAKDAVLPTFNTGNPFAEAIRSQGLTREKFQDIFLNEGRKYWENYLGLQGNNNTINLFTRSDACGAAEIWAHYLGKNQEDLLGIGVFGDPGIAEVVKNDRLGMGYNNIAFAYDINTRRLFPGLGIIPIDVNGNGVIDPEENFYDDLDQLMLAIAEGRYPSPPARELYFVTHGHVKNIAAVEFLKWIVDKGQAFVGEAGYVALSEDALLLQQQKLAEIPSTEIPQ